MGLIQMLPAKMRRKVGNLRAWLRRLRHALFSGLPGDWEATETHVRGRLRVALRPYAEHAERLDDLAFRMLTAAAKNPPASSEDRDLFLVQIALLTRTFQDLRLGMLAVSSGYTMQAWSVAASAFEAAHTMGFVAVDPKRARKWLEHRDVGAYSSAYTAVEGCYKYLELGGPGEDRSNLVKDEYRFYRYLCMAKHVNPWAERTRYVATTRGQAIHMLTPFFSERRLSEARLGLAIACRAATLALWVFHKSQLPHDGEVLRQIADLNEESTRLLTEWLVLVRKEVPEVDMASGDQPSS